MSANDTREAFEAYFLESRRGRGRKHLPTFARLQAVESARAALREPMKEAA